MWTGLGQALPLAFAMAISPIPIAFVIAVLGSERSRTNAPLYLGGFVAGATVLTGAAFALASSVGAATDPAAADGADGVQLVFGSLFLALAVRRFRRRPREGGQPRPSPLLAAVDGFGPGKAFVLGLGASVANPKNLTLSLSGGATMAQAGTTGTAAAVAVALFVALGSLGVATPVAMQLAAPERSAGILASWKTWLEANNSTIMILLFGVIGTKMFGSGLGLFD
jgi:threonine/homoserine/homoserine lactone efflux protein